jgi:hypothetical protein
MKIPPLVTELLNFMKIPPLGAELFHKERQMDMKMQTTKSS